MFKINLILFTFVFVWKRIPVSPREDHRMLILRYSPAGKGNLTGCDLPRFISLLYCGPRDGLITGVEMHFEKPFRFEWNSEHIAYWKGTHQIDEVGLHNMEYKGLLGSHSVSKHSIEMSGHRI